LNTTPNWTKFGTLSNNAGMQLRREIHVRADSL
jgi:hypothetical protein